MLFLNPKSGGGKAARAGLATLVEEAVPRGADAVGVAGGDGSLAVVACVPAGTRNHFALDLELDRRDLDQHHDTACYGCGLIRCAGSGRR